MKTEIIHPPLPRYPNSAMPAWSLAHDRFLRTSFFASLDGLRALSILAVIWHHTVAASTSYSFLRQGKNGVNLFFVISGFLIVTLLLRSKAENRGFSIARFWGRRSLRILPIYYVALVLYVILVSFFEHNPFFRHEFFGNLPAYASFTSNWFVDLRSPRVIFFFAWSLAAEEQFYLVWPWFERFLVGAWPLIAAVVMLILSQAILLSTSGRSPAELPLAVRMLSSVPSSILLGVVLAHLLHSPATFGVLSRISGHRGSAGFALVLMLLALGMGSHLGLSENLVIAGSMMMLVSACVIREDNDLSRMLSIPAVAWIGKVSYGMYLFHMISVNAARRLLSELDLRSPYLDFLGGAVLATVIASVSYVFFESRLLRLKNRIFSDREAPRQGIVGQTPTL
jgi:peptidoglycan/LPS O-acetylase OafA/YrhL